jgi:hemerythrin-like domain-containing protein
LNLLLWEAAMSFSNRISQTLHDEHQATVALMERLEQLIARHRRAPPPKDRALVQLLDDLARELGADVERHFGFEESQLFTYLDAIGDAAIGAHLTDEHVAMRPLGTELAALARNARDNGFDAPGWEEFRRIGGELCERMLAHVQKEEMALLPLLEESMDAETEARLYESYVENA